MHGVAAGHPKKAPVRGGQKMWVVGGGWRVAGGGWRVRSWGRTRRRTPSPHKGLTGDVTLLALEPRTAKQGIGRLGDTGAGQTAVDSWRPLVRAAPTARVRAVSRVSVSRESSCVARCDILRSSPIDVTRDDETGTQ